MSTVSSRVLDIFEAVAAQTVTIPSTEEVVAAVNLSEAVDTPAIADLPKRYLMPFENTTSSGQRESGRPLGIAPLYKVQWSLTEIMLYAPANSGTGLAQFASVLTEYAGAYLGLIANVRAPVQGGSVVLEGWSVQPQLIQYPQESGQWFYGAVCTLTYTENVTLQG